jgi:hypothetical protein
MLLPVLKDGFIQNTCRCLRMGLFKAKEVNEVDAGRDRTAPKEER